MAFNRIVENGCMLGYYAITKLKNNQTATIVFYRHESQRSFAFYVAFAIANKRKHIRKWLDGSDNLTNLSTGKGGLEGLIWAKNQLLEFEEFIKQEGKSVKAAICITWTNNRRRDIYEHYLKRIGYAMDFRRGSKCLSKAIV